MSLTARLAQPGGLYASAFVLHMVGNYSCVKLLNNVTNYIYHAPVTTSPAL